MDIDVIKQMFTLFGMIGVGFAAGKSGVLDPAADSRFSSFLLKIALPATILSSACDQDGFPPAELLTLGLAAAGIFMLLTLLSAAVARIFRLEPTYQLMMNYSNLGFMGLPLILSLYGAQYVIYVVVFMMVFNIHLFTVGVMTLRGRTSSGTLLLKSVLNPGIVSAVLAFVVVLFHIPAPEPAREILGDIGVTTTPLAMIVIGSQLSRVKIADSLKNCRLYLMAFCKLIAYPAVIYGMMNLLLGPCPLTGIAAILMGLPVAGNVTMLCSSYDGDTALAAQGTWVTSAASLVTVPFLLWMAGP